MHFPSTSHLNPQLTPLLLANKPIQTHSQNKYQYIFQSRSFLFILLLASITTRIYKKGLNLGPVEGFAGMFFLSLFPFKN